MITKATKISMWVPERGEVIYIQMDPKSGAKEIGDEHPLLVSSTSAFNSRVGIVIGFPMTHSKMNEDNLFALKVEILKNESAYVLAYQPKSFDWHSRGARKHPLGKGHLSLLQHVHKKLDAICGICG
jgi:mRNA interferase MazF